MEIVKRINSIACGVLLTCSVISGVQANPNPSSATVVHGSVAFAQPNAHTLNIANSHGAIINWQQFSNNQGEITRFIQQGANSAVLNRIVGQDPSKILGQLSSNGKVYLVNPNGIVFGQGSVVNTAGLIASTLNISNQDFLNGLNSGSMRFADLQNAQEILNQGFISTSNSGEVVFIAPKITNKGVISVDNGSIVLAAGQSVTVNSLNYDNIEFEVQAPDNSVVNLGSMISDGGSIGVFAGNITNKGRVSANAVTVDDAGNIVFIAQADSIIENGTVSATSDTGKGGYIEITGNRVGLFGESTVDASGETGGGEILIGGDFQGKNPEIKNSTQTIITKKSTVKADAKQSGDGGKVIIWSDENTYFSGNISVQGGSQAGDGGFVEVSGKKALGFDGYINTKAINGKLGTILLDPENINIVATTGLHDFDVVSSAPNIAFSLLPGIDFSVGVTTINDLGGDITLQAENNITLALGANLNLTSQTAVNTVTFQAGGSILIDGDIFINGGSLLLSASDPSASPPLSTGNIKVNGSIDTNGGNVTLNTNASTDFITVSNNINAGAGTIDLRSANDATINAGTITAASLTSTTGSTIVINGAVSLNSSAVNTALNLLGGTLSLASNSSFAGLFTMSGGSLDITAMTLTLDGGFNWNNAATITGGGTGILSIPSLAIMTLDGDDGAIDNRIVDGVTINNAGSIVMATTLLDNLVLNNNTVLNNTGTFDFMSNTSVTTTIGTGTFNNTGGSVIKSGGDATSTISSSFTNTGGTIDIAGLNTFGLGGADLTLDAGSVLRGGGTFAGNVINNGGSIQPGAAFVANTLTINGNYSGSSGDVTIKVESALNDQLIVTGTADFLNTTLILVDNGAAIFDGLNLSAVISTGTLLNNFASVINPFTGFTVANNINVNDIDLLFNTIIVSIFFDNELADFDLANAINWSTDVLPTSGLDDILLDFSGNTLSLSSNTLNINTLNLTLGTTLNISGGTLDIASNSTLTGDVNLSAGFLSGTGDITLAGNFNWTGGTLAGSGAFITNAITTLNTNVIHTLNRNWINNSTINWSNGTIAGTGTLTNNANLILSSAFQKVLDTATIDNQGTTTFTDAGNFVLDNNATFINNSTFDYQSANADVITTTTGLFDNFATVQRTTNTGNATIAVSFNARAGSIINGVSEAMTFNAMNILGDISTSGFGARLADGTHTIAANAQLLTGSLIWDSTLAASTIQGSGTETLTLAAGTSFDLIGGFSKTLDNVTINNLGVTTFNSTGNWAIENNATFINNNIFDYQSANADVITTTTGLFDNFATVQRTTNTGNAQIEVSFNARAGSVINGVSEAMTFNAMNILGDISTSGFGASLANGTHTIAANAQLLSGSLIWDGSVGFSAIQGSGTETLTLAAGTSFDLIGGFSKTLDNVTINNLGVTTFNSTGNWAIENNATFINNNIFDYQSANADVITTTTGLFDNFATVQRTTNTGNAQIEVSFNARAGSVINGVSEAMTFNAMNILGDISTSGFGASLANGTHTIAANAQLLSGSLIWDSSVGFSTIQGSGTETFTLATGTTFDLIGGLATTLDNVTINNLGMTTFNSTGNWDIENNAIFVNAATGQFDFESNHSDINSASNGLFDNFGLVRRITNTGNGRINVNFNANTGTVIDGVSEAMDFAAMNILGDISTSGFGARLADGTHTIAANAQLLTGSLIWDSTLAASTIRGSGTETLTLAAGTSFDLIGGSIKTVDNVSINNLGVTTFNSGSFIINTPANFINGSTGIFNIAFNGNIAGTGNFTNLGTLQKTAGDGTSNISTGFTNTGGIIDIAGLNTFGLGGADLILDAGSILRGGGTFAGNVINNGGSIQPGTTFVANTLTISGNYLGSGGDVIIKLESAVNDQLIVTGSADFLNTTLILVDNGAAITDGLNLPTVISTGSLLNNFASVTNPFTGFTAANNINGNDIDLLFNLIIAGFIWTGAGDGSSWNDALNWSAGIPGAGANVSIGDFNVTITGGASANTLSLSSGGSLTLASGTFTFTPGNSSTLDGLFVLAGGTLNLTGSTLTLSGGFNWTGAGTIIGGGSGIVNILALTNWAVSGDASGVDNRILDNVTVNNSGTIVMATGLADNLSLINGATLNNQTGGLFDFQSNTDITGTGTFKNNVGSILRKSVATGSSQITAVFENDAAEISVISGVLSLDGGGSFSNALTIADGELRLGGGNYTFNDGGSINSLSGGSLRLTAATIDIPGTVTLNTLLTWAGNTTISGPGNFNISSSGILSIEGDASGVDNRILSGLTLNNSGRIIMATGLADNLVLNDGSILNNQLAGVFDFQSDTAVTNTVGGGTFRNNAGAQLIKSAGAGSAQINTVFENDDALVTINSGSFQLNGVGTFNNALTIAGGELLLNTGSYVFTDGSSINGATGNLGLQNATLSILASDTVTLNNDLRWKNSATISGPGNFIISSTGRLIIQGDASGVDNRIFDNLTMNNFGIIEMATGLADNLTLINGATLNNQTGGLFDFQSDADVTGTGSFNNNAGSTLIKSAATGTSTISATFTQTGSSVDIVTGSLSLNGAPLILDAASVLQGSGTFIGNVDNLAGTVRPGGVGATDILTIDGDYTQGVNGLLQIELQGTTVGTQYDQLAVTGNIIAEGVIAISDTGFLSPSVSDNFIVMTSGGSISGNNKIIFPLGYAFPNKAASQYDITFQNNNTVFFDNFAGDLDWNNANNWSSGLLPGSGVDIDTASLTTGGTILISDGTFDINNLTSNSNINNTGANFTVAGNVTVADNFVYTQDGVSAFTQFDGAFNNTAAAGVLIDNNQGNIIINGTAIAEVTNNGVLSGSGTVVGNVSNGGNFNPGNSPGTFTIDGDLNLLDSSILNIDIAGLVQGDDYDVLIVTGSVNFAGQLNVIIDNSAGYTGNLDDSFSPISFASGSGNLSVTASRGYAYDLTINSNNLNLLTTQVPGLFVPNVQSDIVTLIGSTLNISSFESADDIEADLQRSKDEDEDEKDNVLICT